MVHYLKSDGRISVLRELISPFQVQLDKIMEISDGWSWDTIYADDMEYFVGTVFTILQNYINSSISDLHPYLQDKHLYTKYSIGKKVINSNHTQVALIIAIANFYKHRDTPPPLQKHTRQVFDDLKIDYKEIFDVENGKYYHSVGASSPVFSGFSLLSECWRFDDLIGIVSEWREDMWLNEYRAEANL